MISVKLLGERLILRTETYLKPPVLEEVSNILGAIPSITTKMEKGKVTWSIPKEYIATVEGELHVPLAWLTPPAEIKGNLGLQSKLPDISLKKEELNLLKKPLYPFQIVGANFLVEVKKALLADQMGLGKTITSIAGAALLKKRGEIAQVLVITEASLKIQWASEIGDFTNEDAIVIGGTHAKRVKQYVEAKEQKPLFVITNYELAREDIDYLVDLNPDLVILDEAQRIRSWNAKTTQAILGLENREYKWLLTGTPVQNHPPELYQLYRFMDVKVFGTNYFQFENRYCVKETRNYGKGIVKEIVGYQRFDELHHRISGTMLRRLQEEVGRELPEATEKNIYIEMTPKQAKLHRAVQDELEFLIANKDKLEDDGAIKGMYAMLVGVADAPELLTMSDSRLAKKILNKYGDLIEKDSPKLDELQRLVSSILDDDHTEKVVVFTQFRRMLELAARTLKKYNPVFIHGEMQVDCGRTATMACDRCPNFAICDENHVRRKARWLFINDPERRLIICTDAAKAGQNFQRAGHLINIELPWNPANAEQRKFRIRRLGSTYKTVHIYNLISLRSIDERVLQVIYKKSFRNAQIIEKSEAEKAFLRELDAKVVKKLLGDGK